MKILIVDDDESLSAIITTALEKEGFATFSAKTGRDALQKARSDAPDLILLDQVLPDISGNQVLKELKLDDKTKNIPVMMITNFSQEELVKQAINEGAIDYVFKYKVEIADIVNKIRNVLRKDESAPSAQ
ncbi:MAG: response regulator transcription factor [Patescibacteria group bacterium]